MTSRLGDQVDPVHTLLYATARLTEVVLDKFVDEFVVIKKIPYKTLDICINHLVDFDVFTHSNTVTRSSTKILKIISIENSQRNISF